MSNARERNPAYPVVPEVDMATAAHDWTDPSVCVLPWHTCLRFIHPRLSDVLLHVWITRQVQPSMCVLHARRRS